jgi:23S rRNA pseudouridine1911/1915/1917 synthase
VSAPPVRIATFVVDHAEAGIRLDRFVLGRVPRGSRRGARAAIRGGAVAINGRRARKGDAVHAGDVVRLDLSLLDGALRAQPELPLSTLYVDEAVIGVDKPAGMATVALRAHDLATVSNALLGRYPALRGIGGTPFEAGIAHRLDTPTSGALLVARTPAAWRNLRAQFVHGRVDKLYVAVVDGTMSRGGIVTVPIAHHPDRRRRMCACTEPARATMLRARTAHTAYRPLRTAGGATLLAVRIRTGVRHQIRVHLACVGHPVLGDSLYAGREIAASAPRLLLHAVRVAFTHPVSGRRISVRSPLPDGFLPPGLDSPRRDLRPRRV